MWSTCFLRGAWEAAVHLEIRPESLVGAMLSSKEAWEATSSFATEVLQELRRLERERAKNRNN